LHIFLRNNNKIEIIILKIKNKKTEKLLK